MLRRARPEDGEAVAETSLASRARMEYLPRLYSGEDTRRFFANSSSSVFSSTFLTRGRSLVRSQPRPLPIEVRFGFAEA